MGIKVKFRFKFGTNRNALQVSDDKIKKKDITDLESDPKKAFRLKDDSWAIISTSFFSKKREPAIKVLDAKDFARKCKRGEFTYQDFKHNLLPIGNRKILIESWDDSDEEFDGKNSMKSMPCGLYELEINGWMRLKPIKINQDQYLELNEDISNQIYADIETFIQNKKRYEEMNVLHKRGILLYGSAGNGKTMILNHVLEHYKDMACILFVKNDNVFNAELFSYRDFFTGQLVIFVVEELTQITHGGYGIGKFLSFLDGQESWNDSLFIATTNYPELLPGNIVDRPSRFDRIFKIEVPDRETRRIFLESFLKEECNTDLLDQTEGYSIAYLKEICIQTHIMQRGLSEVLKEIQNRKDEVSKNFADCKKEDNDDIYV